MERGESVCPTQGIVAQDVFYYLCRLSVDSSKETKKNGIERKRK